MWEFEDRTVWTSDYAPLMVSYNKGKMQHSLRVVGISNSSFEVANYESFDSMSLGMSVNYFFRRIWHGKGSQTAASKVFLATDNDAMPIICSLLQEQKKLLSLRLQSLQINNEIGYDIKPDMSWSISAIAAAAVTVTRPKEKQGQFPLKDIIALAPDITLLLYGNYVCANIFCLRLGLKEQLLSRMRLSQINNRMHDLKIVDLVDAVEGRINLILNNGQICRCTLRCSPSSCLADDCITAMEEGLSVTLYSHFLSHLWVGDDSTYMVQANSSADSEWESFCNVITKICGKCSTTSSLSNSITYLSWEFLIQSKYHKQYVRTNYIAADFTGLSSNLHRLGGSGSVVADKQNTEETVYLELLTQTLDSLHAVYETLKLDNLRRRDLALLVIILCDIADFLHEVNYVDHYKRDFPRIAKDFQISKCLVTPKKSSKFIQMA